MPLYRSGFGWVGWSSGRRIPTIIRVTRPQSIESAKLIGIRKRISGSSHQLLPQFGLICICRGL
ncbi:hypothetical protein F4804DRAFT_310404 [Jackrogersella minutella]|nr:hypothetical protein F4804DRAFT_310404 [Jackrogersella minutella]